MLGNMVQLESPYSKMLIIFEDVPWICLSVGTQDSWGD